MGGRWRRVVVMLAVLALSAPPHSLAGAPDPASVALARLGHETGRADAFRLAYSASYALPVSGRRLWAGKFLDEATGDLRIMYVDGADALTPAELAAREGAELAAVPAFARKADPALRRARDRGDNPVALSLWLDADTSSAVDAVFARHPDIARIGDRPDVSDPTLARQVRGELYDARAAVYARAEADASRLVGILGGVPGYASSSAPLLFANVPAAALDALAARPEVASMAGADQGGWGETMAYAGPTVKADWAYSQGYRGSGVRVADVEYYNVKATGDLSGKVVAYHNVHSSSAVYDTSGLDHPTWVAGAIASQSSTWRGSAPASGIVSSSTGGGSASLARDQDVIAATDWAISSGGADIVNTSLGQDTATGREEARKYFDSIVWEGSRISVSAAGNYSTFGNWDIVSPGTGWNVITVGGTDDKNTTSWSDDRIWYSTDGSCYADPAGTAWNPHGDFNKPNVVAPAVDVRTANGWTASGTSVATPITAGVLAELMGRNGTFVNWPEIPRALLMAGAIHHTVMPDGTINRAHEGVGTVDAEWANRILDGSSYGGYKYGSLSASGTSTSFSVAKGQNVRVALVWDSHTSGSSLSKTDTLTADLDLRVTFPDGTTKSSLSFDNNYEFVEYTPSASGTATVNVGATRFDASSEDYALAWAKWPTVSDSTPPTAPTNLVASPIDTTSVSLSWLPSTDDTAVAGYRISRNGTQVASVSPASATAADAKSVNPGTYVNSPTLGVAGAVVGDANTAVSFNGSSQYVGASAVTLASQLTLEAWVKSSILVGNSAIAGEWAGGTGSMLYVVDASHVAFYTNSTRIVASVGAADAWHHIVGTYDGSVGRLYIDGVLLGGPTSGVIATPAGAFQIATYGNAAGAKFGGAIDEVAYYARALSATEVANHYGLATGSGASYASTILGTSGLVSYWRLGETGKLTWADTGLAPGTRYDYSVVAFDAAGNVSPAATASATTPSGSADTQPPTAPTDLTKNVLPSGMTKLSWGASTDNVGVAGYWVYRNDARFAKVTGTTYQVKRQSGTFSYFVTAFDAAGNESGSSNIVSVTVP